MCGGCFPQAEQPAWPQLSKPQALGEDEEEKGGLEKEKGGLGGSSGESGELGKGLNHIISSSQTTFPTIRYLTGREDPRPVDRIERIKSVPF
ncbi:unnamed protein product [Tetraodon nigroviridis]|uniref:(spotted green pufferfish) hypothetical protein n=1 Tax=Tetraodon nigroviridis TaxID=99883 RepID=Q4RU38_TETNG|nr:unnamed protein product [Tetraodon nigroviridis]